MEQLHTETREAWLKAAASKLYAELLSPHTTTPVPKIRISCGWGLQGPGRHSRHIGICYHQRVSDDATMEVFISPELSQPVGESQFLGRHTKNGVLSVLLHELCHTLAFSDGHRGEFKRIATAAGLEGRMTQTTPSATLNERLRVIADSLPPYPHASMNMDGGKIAPVPGNDDGNGGGGEVGGDVPVSSRPKQSTRLLKATCGKCRYVIRVTKTWADIGLPICPTDKEPFALEA